MTSEVTCKHDHHSRHASHVSIVPILHVAAQHQASLKMPCCIAISRQHTVLSVTTALCWMAKEVCYVAVLDWRTCKDLSITKEKGAEVKQAPAAYPASCTAACYIARSHADGITTPNYLQVIPPSMSV